MSRRNHCFNWDMRLYGTTEGWWDPSDASSRTIATGVSQLNDKSGNARHFTQSTGANQPTVVSAAQNGLDTLSFDGSNDTMSAGTTSTWNFIHNGTTNYAFQIVKCGNSSDPNVSGAIHSTRSSGGTNGAVLLYDDRASVSRNNAINDFGATTAFIWDNYNLSGVAAGNNNVITPNAYSLISVQRDGNATPVANRSILKINNGSNIATTQFSPLATYTGNSGAALHIGSEGGSGSLFVGQQGEFVIYSALNTNYSISFINNLINHKWGVY